MSETRSKVSVQSLKNQCLIADQCFVADRFFDRLKGWMGVNRAEPGQGILLSPCNDIHMWFMNIPIDVVFIRRAQDSDKATTWTVSSVRENVRPWKLLPLRDGNATDTLELPVGTIQRCTIIAGDQLCIS